VRKRRKTGNRDDWTAGRGAMAAQWWCGGGGMMFGWWFFGYEGVWEEERMEMVGERGVQRGVK
jgi:hypothetical protein